MGSVGECLASCGRFWFRCFLRWRLWIRPFVFLCYLGVLIVLVPMLVYNCLGAGGCTPQKRTQIIGGVFALLAMPITFWEITQHLVHYTKPYLQKHVIRILWMVPIYAGDAWIGLIAPEYSIYCNSLRECYEAYVIYNFMKFLLNYLNAEMDLEANLELKQQVHHFFPLCCLRDWEMGREFVHKCKHGILQYTIFRPLTTSIAFICEQFGAYGEDEYKANVAFPYMIAVNNVSQALAMYCLVLFYKANKDELQPMRPLGKFLCIKAVVFFSFFQGVAISILVNTGMLDNVFGTTENNDIRHIASSLQNFLICIEMFFAAIAHHYSFNHKAYVDMAADQPNCCESFCQMWDVSDVKQDLEEHLGVVKNTFSNVMPSKVYRHPGGMREERAHLLSNSDGGGGPSDYNSGGSGNEGGGSGGGGGVSGITRATRSASLDLVAEIGSEAVADGRGDEEDPFTDLSEDEALVKNKNKNKS